jgi:hypothetical protein
MRLCMQRNILQVIRASNACHAHMLTGRVSQLQRTKHETKETDIVPWLQTIWSKLDIVVLAVVKNAHRVQQR